MINEEDPGYHPPKIPMNFKKYPGLITIHMGMVAGFFDTEGSVGIQARVTAYKTKTKGTQFYNSLNQWIHFTNTNLRPLRKIKKILESWPFHFTPTIYRDNSKMLDKKGKLQKVRYKLKLPNSQHRLFMAMFGPIIMIGAKRQLDRFDDLAFVDKRFFQSGKWNKKKRKSWSTHTF